MKINDIVIRIYESGRAIGVGDIGTCVNISTRLFTDDTIDIKFFKRILRYSGSFYKHNFAIILEY